MWQAIVSRYRYLRDSGRLRAAIAAVILPYLAVRLKMDESAAKPIVDAIVGLLIGMVIPTGSAAPVVPVAPVSPHE